MRAIEGVLKRMALLVGFIAVLLSAACTGLWNKSPQPDEAQSGRAAVETPAMQTPAPDREEAKPPAESEVERTVAEPAAPDEEQDEPVPQAMPESRVTEAKPAAAKPSAPSPPAPAPAPEAATGQVEEQATPPLDLDSLEQRLKETSAIGFFTKLALKNQVGELLEKFRAYYQGHSNVSLAQLRQPYELLIMKVLALLQDSDPPLARDILDSREAIWKVLADPEKFATL